jgi:NAD(P) transhydrogenase subunit alpha
MRIGVPKETAVGERRVALVPDGVKRLAGKHEVVVERGAGVEAGFPDAAYEGAGAALADAAAALDAELVLKVQRPSEPEVAALREGGAIVALLVPHASEALLARLAARRVTAYSMELVPRTTKAQAMDVLSSQATLAGYKAVLLGASALGRVLPMLTTAAGTLSPARALVIGAGVAGLQAIATARRLGAVVTGFDVRAAAREQVLSLGATFLESAAVSPGAEAAGGYARELAQDEQQRVLETIGGALPGMDLVVTTAQIPGKPAPRLITASMAATMKPGAVIVDLAAEGGGNCELTRAGETVVAGGVTILGPVNLAASVPTHASQMYSRNLQTFVEYAAQEAGLVTGADDPIAGPMCVTHAGEVRYRRPQ